MLDEWDAALDQRGRILATLRADGVRLATDLCTADQGLQAPGVQSCFGWYVDQKERGQTAPQYEITVSDTNVWGPAVVFAHNNTRTFIARADGDEAESAKPRAKAITDAMSLFEAAAEWVELDTNGNLRRRLQDEVIREARKVRDHVRLHGRCEDCRSLRHSSLYERNFLK